MVKTTYSREELERKLAESRREFWAADATINNLELRLAEMATQLANKENECAVLLDELEAEKQRAKVLFMENARLKSGIAGLIHLGIRYADVEVMKIAGDAQLSTPCTDSIINSIAAV